MTCSLGTLVAGTEVAVASVGTQVTVFEEGLFGTSRVTSTSFDPDPADNIVTTEVLIEHGPTS